MPLWAWNPATMTCGVIVLWSNWTAATAEIPTIDVTLCEPAGHEGEAALEGFVEDDITGVRLPAAHVIASYPVGQGLERVETVVRTDSLGRYRLCDLPVAAEVELAAAYGPHTGQAILVQAVAGDAVTLGVPVTLPGSITGVVIHGGTGRPLRQVTIELVDTDLRAVANGSAGFRLQGLPPGSYRVRASCIGFEGAERSVDLAEGGQVRVQLTLEPRHRRVRRCGS
ncbi:carboxypeptidase regulatory-like domain-containing protein [Candidatus Palauibacter sp.]|uniref:carboxypeptidase regulatory-like domain-containing protein n=1 Tax=Candidatus Palauibacter sp. TaxID=3101350 RepID=UPI003B517A60